MYTKIKKEILLASLFLILYIFVCVYIQYGKISEFNSLPSPIYGGDLYYQMGSIIHILDRGNPFESSSIRNTIPGYLPLYSFSCAQFCNIFNFDVLHCMFYFSLFIFAISAILYFFVFKVIFNDNYIAILGSIIANKLSKYPILKYTPFTSQITLPLFILTLFLSYKNKKPLFYLLLGISYGMLAISHVVCFAGATITLLAFFFSEIIGYKKSKIVIKISTSHIKNYTILFLSALPLIMLYWYKPLFLYHLNIKTNVVSLSSAGSFHNPEVQIKFFLNSIKRWLFNFDSVFYATITILVWIGIYSFYRKREESANSIKRFILIFFKRFIALSIFTLL